MPTRPSMLRVLSFASCLAAPALASAQTGGTDLSPTQGPMHMLNEPAGIVDVVDSFDVGSTFSFRTSLGYSFQSRSALIERESRTATAAGGAVQLNRVGNYRETTHTLLANVELGLYHDFAFTLGIPVVLSNSREIRALADPSGTEGQNALRDGWTLNGAETNLFNLPFRSPDRAGIDQIRLGLSWAILNQQRDRTKPTWVVRAEWRPPVGDNMHACNADAQGGSAQCPAAPSVQDVNANVSGTNATAPLVRATSAGGAGISRGVHGLYFQTVLSRRFGYVEPYGGFDILAEFPQRSSLFRYLDTPYGLLANFPPIVSSLVVGAEIIPWENRETWQRVVIDLRLRGAYYSQGRDYSVLYDALGSSTSRALAQPGCPSNARMNNGTCQAGREIFFDGLTGTASYASLGANVTVGIQAAKFLRFNLGAGIAFVTSHLVTSTDACNPNQTPPPEHPEWRGGCVSNSAPDPLHRPVIDSPGGRFRTSDETLFNIQASIALTPRFF